MDAIDFVFKTKIDDPVQWLSQIREKHLLTPEVLEEAAAGKIISESALNTFDRETRIQTISMSGMRIPESDKFFPEHYERLQRELSAYWYQKGTTKVVDFISYVLNVPISINVMWTEDYETFLVEGSSDIGQPVYEGGTWYPTSHVQFAYDPESVPGIPLGTLLSLFYALANYNIVVGSIALDLFLAVAQNNEANQTFPGFVGSASYAVGLYVEVDVALSGTTEIIEAPIQDVVVDGTPVDVDDTPVTMDTTD
jgi:hypothetical protein